MKKLVMLSVFMTAMVVCFGQVGTKYKEIYWKEAGFKFMVPVDLDITSQDDESMELENDDYLVFLDIWDELDPLEETLAEEKEEGNVLKMTMPLSDLDEETYSGEMVSYFENLEGVNDSEITVFTIRTNLESKVSDKKIEFDLSVYEFNKDIEEQLDMITGSAEFVGKGYRPTAALKKNVAIRTVPEAEAPKKKGFAAGLLKNAALIGLDMVPGGSVVKGLLGKFLE